MLQGHNNLHEIGGEPSDFGRANLQTTLEPVFVNLRCQHYFLTFFECELFWRFSLEVVFSNAVGPEKHLEG